MAFDYDAEMVRYQPRLVTAAGVRAGDDVLDVGCGTGLTTREMAAVAASAVGVDISVESLATARQLGRGLSNIEFGQGDAQTFAFPADRFSLGISRFGTMFFTDPATVERLLTAAGFTNVELTDIREPVYYGPDAEAARDAALNLRLTQNLLADLGPAGIQQALERLLTSYESHRTSTGIWLDTRAWLVTARRSS